MPLLLVMSFYASLRSSLVICIVVIVGMIMYMRVIRICSINRSLIRVFIIGPTCVDCDIIFVSLHTSTLLTVSVVVAVCVFVTAIATYTVILVVIVIVAAPSIANVYGLSFLYI